jgi:hypothetical protein
MQPFDEMPFEQDDHSDVALLVAGSREFPSEEFARELDARVARRFAPRPGDSAAPADGHRWWRRPPRWTAAPAALVVAGAVAAAVIVPDLGSGGAPLAAFNGGSALVTHASRNPPRSSATGIPDATSSETASGAAGSTGTPSTYGAATPPALQPVTASKLNSAAAFSAPSVPGARQIKSAQITLSTPNEHVNQVAQEVITVVANEHGTVQNSRITSASRSSGGGYATFTLSIPTGNLQAAMTQLARLRFAALNSSTAGSQNVSSRYDGYQQKLGDAQALRTSLLKQLQTADSQTAIDSIEAQIKTAERQIAHWQSTLHSLQHQISYSDVSVQVNAGGLPVTPTAGTRSGFTITRAVHDALGVLVVSAGVAVIVLAALIPFGLVAALLMWLWVWLRQRRREQALDAS